jgi:hypothetical protein
MIYLVYIKYHTSLVCCNMCNRSCVSIYYIQYDCDNRVYHICDNCYDMKWQYKKYNGLPTPINKNALLLPLAWCRCCDVCSSAENVYRGWLRYSSSCSKIIFATCIEHNFNVCRTCLSNQLTKVMHKILPERRTRELMETLHEHTTQQDYFSYLNYSEQNMIKQEHTTIKKLIDLPNVLCDIVLSYYWIF